MSGEMYVLLLTAGSVGFIHTILGPDHYLPFAAMARAGGWSRAKTALVTALCGAGHVLGSVALGAVGIALGVAVQKLDMVESARGDLAAWGLIAFGTLYLAWGLRRAAAGHHHAHPHGHGTKNLTPWILFTIFVFGPCEPLIPILMYPAAKSSIAGLVLVVAVFGAVTVLTMLASVFALLAGTAMVPRHGALERYSHALAGATVLFCGVSIKFLGL